MGVALKSLNIMPKILAQRSNAIWDILLATMEESKALDGSILTTKWVRLQTEYLDTRKTKIMLGYILEDQLGAFFAQYEQVGEDQSEHCLRGS